MSQSLIDVEATYILSTNGAQSSGNEIVVSVLREPQTASSMNSIQHQGHVVPTRLVNSHNNAATSTSSASSNPAQFLSAGDNVTATHTQTSNEQSTPALPVDAEATAPASEVTLVGDAEQKSNSSTEEDSYSKGGLGVCWPKDAVLKLISLHMEHQPLFDDSHYKKKSIWEMVSRKMKEASMNYSWSQAENKWKSLTKRYRDTQDYNAKHNVSVVTHTCPFYEELYQAYNYLSPHATFSVPSAYVPAVTSSVLPVNASLKRPAESVASLSEADLATLRKKKYQNTSGSMYACSTQSTAGVPSAVHSVDLGLLLRSIHEDRTRQDRQKMDRLERMHKEKMDLFKQFLDVIKDIKK